MNYTDPTGTINVKQLAGAIAVSLGSIGLAAVIANAAAAAFSAIVGTAVE